MQPAGESQEKFVVLWAASTIKHTIWCGTSLCLSDIACCNLVPNLQSYEWQGYIKVNAIFP